MTLCVLDAFTIFLKKSMVNGCCCFASPSMKKDRLDPVSPDASLTLDAALLAEFPAGYRHLAYIQTRIGYKVTRDMPTLTGPVVEALYARGRELLQGGAL